jgi:hypothetical protein
MWSNFSKREIKASFPDKKFVSKPKHIDNRTASEGKLKRRHGIAQVSRL